MSSPAGLSAYEWGTYVGLGHVMRMYHEIAYRVAATCRQQGRRLLDFLVAAGEATLLGHPPPLLLPARQGS